MISRSLFAFILFHHAVFSLSLDSTQPREYLCPPSVPQSNYLSDIDIALYRSKFEKPIPDWIVETVKEELAYFKEHLITQKALKATFERVDSFGHPSSSYLRRYRVVGDRIYRYHGAYGETETDLILRTLARLSDLPGIPDLPNADFMINHNDGMPMFYDLPGFWITENKADQAPVLSGGKRVDAPYVIAIPHRSPMPSWKGMCNQAVASRSPWNTKIRVACWRGNSSDLQMPPSSPEQLVINYYMKQPRYLIGTLSLSYPDFINAGFSNESASAAYHSQALEGLLQPLKKGYISPQEHIRYAYLPILDGAMISGGGYEWRLLSNSLVFKPDSPYIAWFEHGLKPYVHYIPIHSNMDDLIEKIQWARAHDKDCEEIANNGADFALNNLMLENLYFYFFYFLQEYEKCQAFNAEDMLKECEQDPKWIRIR